MKTQKFGLEVELTGITRAQAAEVVRSYFGSTARVEHIGGSYDEYRVTASDGRVWKIVRDASILCKKKERRRLVPASWEYSVELVSPILTYEDIERVQELVRRLRAIGGISESTCGCGLHIHVGAERHTPRSLANLVNIVASKEDLLYKSLQVDQGRLRYCQKVNENLVTLINRHKPRSIEGLANLWYANYGQEPRNQHYHRSRYHGLNLHSTFEKGTIEFRAYVHKSIMCRVA